MSYSWRQSSASAMLLGAVWRNNDMDPVFLDAQPRILFGKKLGALRRARITPMHVYGKAISSLSLQVDTSELQETLTKVGRTTPFTIRVDGDEHFVIVREIQRHPVTENILHVDLMGVSQTEVMRADVPLVLEGASPAARIEGVQLVQDQRSVQVEALPQELPSSITVDISVLTELDSGIYIRDLSLPRGVEIITPSDLPVIRVTRSRVAAASEDATVATESPDGEEPLDQAPAPDVIDSAEPIVEESPDS